MANSKVFEIVKKLKSLTRDMGVWFDLETEQRQDINFILGTYNEFKKAQDRTLKIEYFKILKTCVAELVA